VLAHQALFGRTSGVALATSSANQIRLVRLITRAKRLNR